ncbi:MAG: hypoxanthine phosphoribosyltransferase [bacterium]
MEEVGQVLFSEDKIRRRIKTLAAEIDKDYFGREIFCVGVLKGAFVFMSDLIRFLESPITMDFMSIASYGDTTSSTGVVKLLKDLDTDVESKHVLVVEDIVDTGLTLNYLLKNLSTRHPATLKVCTLLDRPARRKVKVDVHYVGFTIPDVYVVGYGLDFAQKYRNLPYIAELSPVGA